MAATLDTTIGGASANSYVSRAEAQSYFDEHLYGSTWDDADEDSQTRALIMATRLLDTRFEWYGAVTDLTQKLLWPRIGVVKPGIAEGQTVSGIGMMYGEPFADTYDSDEIPDQIKWATCEYALALLTSNRTADSDLETYGVTSFTAGPVSFTFAGATAKPVPDAVAAYAARLGMERSGGGAGAITMLRG